MLLLWNKTFNVRFPLSSAISNDEGKTWVNVKSIDETPGSSYAYPAAEFSGKLALITYYQNPDKKEKGRTGISLKFKSIPVSWFYQ